MIRRILLIVFLLAAAGGVAFAGVIAWLGGEDGRPSVCHGDAVYGSLEGGRRLPLSGKNYRAYSVLGFLLGRTFVHGTVRDVMRDAYADLSVSHPELRFLYAEAGWPWGGRFWPHKTHGNGTSVDFHVPVRTLDGTVDLLPGSPFNQFGYAVEFDGAGRSGDRTIDFEAMALHLLALEKAARAHRIAIKRIIFDVKLQPALFAAGSGRQLAGRIPFNSRQAWVRHDEHYHVDFDVPCR